METSLHRELKEQFREPGSEIEVKLGRYRIDVVNGNRLVEIQQSGLAAIRDKVQKLLVDYEVDVVKPLVARKQLTKLSRKNGRQISKRWSPKKGTILDLFNELLYFTRVFPHPNLRLIVPLVEIEEIRYPGHGRRRRWRRNDFVIADRKLIKTVGMEVFERGSDLHRLLPANLESPFDTGQLATSLSIGRWEAQRIAYVMNKTGTAKRVGKKGNAHLYELVPDSENAQAAPKRKTKSPATKAVAKKPAKKKVRKKKLVAGAKRKKATRKTTRKRRSRKSAA